jgi:hypothetical protein
MSNIRGTQVVDTVVDINQFEDDMRRKKFLGWYSGYSWYGLARTSSYRFLPKASTILLSYLIVRRNYQHAK